MKNKNTNLFISIGLIVLIIVGVVGAIIFTNSNNGEKSYTITFNVDGKVYTTHRTLKTDAKVKKPETPKKEGYEFVGWYEGEEEFNFDDSITGDVELTAKWKKTTGEIENEDPTVEPEPTESPVPTESPLPTESPKPTTSPKKNNYTITVVGGTGSGTYTEGTEVTIQASIPETKVSDWIENVTAINGKTRHKDQTTYTWKQWSDGNKNQTRKITVTGNATYKAEFDEKVTQINYQREEKEYAYGYPSQISFNVTHSDRKEMVGYIQNKGVYTICTNNNECSFQNVTNFAPVLDVINGNWKWGTEKWKITYNYKEGIVTVSGGTQVSSPVTLKLNVSYSDNEVGGLVPEVHEYGVIEGSLRPIGGVSYNIVTKKTSKKSSSPIKLSLQLDKVKVSATPKWVDINN